jgi:transposase-like protein
MWRNCWPSGLHADHVTVWRWVQRYAQEMERRLRSRLKQTNDSWRVDETYIRVKGKWVYLYLYRAVDSSGATIDFLLSAKRDTVAAKRFLAKALEGANHPRRLRPRLRPTNDSWRVDTNLQHCRAAHQRPAGAYCRIVKLGPRLTPIKSQILSTAC